MKSHDHQHINKDRLADSAGVPWDGRAFNENPFADDDGSANPALISAIENFHVSADPADVFIEFSKSRLLIPLLANLGESEQGAHGLEVDKSAELSIVNVRTPDDQVGLPVFSSVVAMQRWNANARPVPSDAIKVAIAAASEGSTRIILDPGSETEFAFRRNAIAALAQQKNWIHPALDEQVISQIEQGAKFEKQIIEVTVEIGDPASRLSAPEVKIEFGVESGLAKDELEKILNRVTKVWAEDEIIASRVDSLSLVVKPKKI
jgi:hypothetical protein